MSHTKESKDAARDEEENGKTTNGEQGKHSRGGTEMLRRWTLVFRRAVYSVAMQGGIR